MLRRIGLITASGFAGAAMIALVQIRAGALFGATPELDAFVAGAAMPSILLAISAAAVSTLIIPRLSRDPARAGDQMSRFLTAALFGTLFLTAIAEAAAPLLIRLIAPGFDAHTSHVATDVLRIYALSLTPTVLAHVYSAFGYSNGKVWTGGLSTMLYGASWLVLLFVPVFSGDVQGATFAGLIATAVQVVSAFLLSAAGGQWPRPRLVPVGLDLSRPAGLAFLAIIAATAVNRAGWLLDPFFGSRLAAGTVAELAYASRALLLAVFLCGQGAAFALLVSGRERSSARDVETRIGLVAPLWAATGAAMALLVASPDIARAVLERGRFTGADADAVGTLMRLYAPSVVVITILWSLESLSYAARNVRAVLVCSAIGFAVNFGASAGLVAWLDADGRPLGVAAGVTIQCALLFWWLREDDRRRILLSPATGLATLLIAIATGAAALLGLTVGDAIGGAWPPVVGAIAATAAITLLALRRSAAWAIRWDRSRTGTG